MSEDLLTPTPRTRSTATAAAVYLLSGLKPAVYREGNGDAVTFEFPASAEPALAKFLSAKRTFDRAREVA